MSTSAPSSFANEGRSVPHRPHFAKPGKGSCSREPSKDLPRSTGGPDLLQRSRTGDARSAAGMSGFSASSTGGSVRVRTFQLSPSSVLKIQKGDITVWSVDGSTDAIVNAADQRMLGGGGVDGDIHIAAGPELLEACQKVPEVWPRVRCPTGEARITPAFRLPVSHVIHTVGPIYYSDEHPEISLTNAYRNSLKLAKENNVQYIAFPAISCGVYRYPFKEASRIAVTVAKEFPDSFKEIHFVLFTDELYGVWLKTANATQGCNRLSNVGLANIALSPKRIERPSVALTPDEDSAPTARSTHRETRGTHSDRLRRQIEERGRLPITFRKSDDHPIGVNAVSFMTELGLSIKKFAPLQAKSWKQVPVENKRMIYDRLSAAFDISFKEDVTSVLKETDRLMSARYRDNRNKMHTHYKSLLYLPPSERRHHMPIKFCETQKDWDYMCDLFESENFQTRWAKNAQNRSQLTYNHRGGSKSFIQYSYDGTDQSQRKDRITVFNTTHCSSSKGWIRERAESTYGDMVRLRDEYIQSQETADDIDVVQIADQVLGVRSGYIRGLESGTKPVRSTSSEVTSSSRVTNATLRDKLESTQEKLESIQEELANTRVQLASTQNELTLMRSRQDVFEAILNRLAPGALQALIQESSSVPHPPPPQS